MEDVEFLGVDPLGEGSFGCVRKAVIKSSGAVVAVKTLSQRLATWEAVLSLREVQCLLRLAHPNIVALQQVVRHHDCSVHLIFEYVEGSLLHHMQRNGENSSKATPLSHIQVRNVIYQILQGLSHMHARQIMHRDLKPENILLDRHLTVKICDLGLARVVTDEPPFTSYHATRWYRAPELLLQADAYTTAVDMWAIGCLMPELFTGRPLFPGTSELHQLVTICAIKGHPTEETWPEGMALARQLHINFPQHQPQHWSNVCPNVDPKAMQLIEAALRWDPKSRCTAKEALSFPLFDLTSHDY